MKYYDLFKGWSLKKRIKFMKDADKFYKEKQDGQVVGIEIEDNNIELLFKPKGGIKVE